MTDRERVILEELAGRYHSSAHAAGGRKLRLRAASAFPGLDRRKPDEYESFLEACETLEKEGIVSLVWVKRAKGEELEALVLENPAVLFSRLGRDSPTDSCADSREAARLQAGVSPFFAWLSETLSPKDLDPETLEPRAATIADAARLARALERIAQGRTAPKLPRALSVELFSDSKRIERLLRAIQAQLRRAERAGISTPPFELADRSFPETFIAGALSLRLPGGSSIENPAGCVLGIPFETAVALSAVAPSVPKPALESAGSVASRSEGLRLLSIENKESFFDLASRLVSRPQSGPGPAAAFPFDALLYSGGHPNRAVQTLVRRFAESGWSLFHAGDLDPDGILILQELSDAAGQLVIPWMMDRAVFERYAPLGRPLDAEIHRRALLVRPDTLQRSALGELLEAILESGVMVEQEIIAY